MFTIRTMASAAILAMAAAGAANAQGKTENTLEEIVVTSDRSGFGANYVQAGTFRNGRQIDTPLTVSVIPVELLDAQLAVTVNDALRNTPGVSTAAINATVYSNLSMRGIPIENRGNWRLNGSLPIVNLVDLPMENKARVEALKGASALYYGFSTPSGIVNLVTKRATQDPVTDVRLFGNLHGTYGAHIDVGRRFGDVGVRVNALASGVDPGIDRTSGKRWFLSGAVDWEPNEQFDLQLDAEYIYKTITEPTTLRPITTPAGLVLPSIDSLKDNVGSEWFKSPAREYNLLARAEYRFTPAWAVTFNAGLSDLSRDRRFSDFRITNPATGAGTLTVELANENDYRNEFVRGEIAGVFDTGPFEHEIVAGIARNEREAINPRTPTVTFANNYFNPVRVPETPLPARQILNRSVIEDLGYYAFDRISYREWIELTLGIRKTEYEETTRAFSVTNVETRTVYKTSPTSLSVGLLIKPREWISAYATYIEGLENARIAPSTAVNAGESLPAAVSEQQEFGVKAQITPAVLLTAAYFDIDRASSFLNAQNRFVLDGLAEYKGVELSLTGELTNNLSIYASALFLDAKQVSGSANIGNRIENAAKRSGSIFLEYQLPQLPGLKLSAGVFHAGNRAGNAANTFFVPSYTTLDLGASYATEISGRPTTFRIYADNVTNKKYWSSASSSLIAPALPPSVKLSVETSF